MSAVDQRNRILVTRVEGSIVQVCTSPERTKVVVYAHGDGRRSETAIRFSSPVLDGKEYATEVRRIARDLLDGDMNEAARRAGEPIGRVSVSKRHPGISWERSASFMARR